MVTAEAIRRISGIVSMRATKIGSKTMEKFLVPDQVPSLGLEEVFPKMHLPKFPEVRVNCLAKPFVFSIMVLGTHWEVLGCFLSIYWKTSSS